MVKGRTQIKAPSTKKVAAVSTSKKPTGPHVGSPGVAAAAALRKPTVATVVPSCGSCGILITDDVKALQCDMCQGDQWKCIDCLNISADVYDQLISEPACKCLKWFCDGCDKIVSCLDVNNITATVMYSVSTTMDKFTDMMTNMELNMTAKMAAIEQALSQKADREEVKNLDITVRSASDRIRSTEGALNNVSSTMDKIADTMRNMEQNLHTKMTAVEQNLGQKADMEVQGAVEGALQQNKEEEMEIDRRKKNVIVHGVAESQAETSDQKIEEDLAVLAAMFQEVGVDGLMVESVVRLGKRSENPAHPRSMKVVLNSVDGKQNLIRNAKNLRSKQDGGWEKVFVHQYVTPRQREARKPLVAELKQRKANGEADLIIFNGKVVKKRGY